ncbi:hypothetical protein VTJ04DRAFT_741 [Mycothermus thermophilus]|uniref:uncharacterized protein n=1 Tax=Humicola insolens TaxID=85995 RepID=UPI003741E9A8
MDFGMEDETAQGSKFGTTSGKHPDPRDSYPSLFATTAPNISNNNINNRHYDPPGPTILSSPASQPPFIVLRRTTIIKS